VVNVVYLLLGRDLPLIIRTLRPGSWADLRGIHRGDVILTVGNDALTQTDRFNKELILKIFWNSKPLEVHLLRGKYRIIEEEIRMGANANVEDYDLEFPLLVSSSDYDLILRKTGFFDMTPFA